MDLVGVLELAGLLRELQGGGEGGGVLQVTGGGGGEVGEVGLELERGLLGLQGFLVKEGSMLVGLALRSRSLGACWRSIRRVL